MVVISVNPVLSLAISDDGGDNGDKDHGGRMNKHFRTLERTSTQENHPNKIIQISSPITVQNKSIR